MNFFLVMNAAAGVVFGGLMLTVLVCVVRDRRTKRAPAGPVPVSVIVPCYNDAATVADTLRSVFASHPAHLLDVVVVNDGSTDDSLERIGRVARELPLRVVHHPVNRGKAASLNEAVPMAGIGWWLLVRRRRPAGARAW